MPGGPETKPTEGGPKVNFAPGVGGRDSQMTVTSQDSLSREVSGLDERKRSVMSREVVSRDTGLGESLAGTSLNQSRFTDDTHDSDDEQRAESKSSKRANSATSTVKSQMTPHEMLQDGIKKLRFFTRAYQAIKSSKQEEKKSHVDLGELASLLAGAQVDIVEEEEDSDDEDEMKIFKTFDHRQYRFKQEYTWPYLALEPVWRKPSERGVRDIKIIRNLMRGMRCFRRLPLRVQNLCAKYVRLERCTRGRTIIRKGQVPENFFFVYAGKANVSRFEDEESVYEASQVIAQLRKGDYFGGFSIACETGREFTVVAMEDCEFLVIDVDDFPETGLGQIFLDEMETRFQLLRHHKYLADMDDDTLRTIVLESRTLDAPHDTVIVKHSRKCGHVYLVCKGDCTVMKWLSAKDRRSTEEDSVQFPTMRRTSYVLQTSDLPPPVTPKTPLRTSTGKPSLRGRAKTGIPSRESRMSSSLGSLMIQREMEEIRSNVGNLAIEYTTFPLIGVTKEEQLEYWQRTRAERNRQKTKEEEVKKRDEGIFITLEQIGADMSFGLPGDLKKMEDMQLVSNGATLVEIPLSSFDRYFPPSIHQIIRKQFSRFNLLLESSKPKFSNENTWQAIKKGFTADVREQKEHPEFENYDIYYMEGGRPPVNTKRVDYNWGQRTVHFSRPRHSITNLQSITHTTRVTETVTRPRRTGLSMASATPAASRPVTHHSVTSRASRPISIHSSSRLSAIRR